MSAIPASKVTVSTATYEARYGRKPRGRGKWAFDIGPGPVFIPGVKTYAQAKKEAVKIAAAMGARFIGPCT